MKKCYQEEGSVSNDDFFFQERCYIAYFIKSIDSLITWVSLAFKVKIFKNKWKLFIFSLVVVCPTHGNHAQIPCISTSPRVYSDWAMLSNHHTLCCPLLFPLSIFPSIKVFSKDTALCIWWPKYWGFSFSISPSSEYSGLPSFTIAWFDLSAVQGTLKILLQHHSSKASVRLCSTFSIIHLSHLTWLPEKP